MAHREATLNAWDAQLWLQIPVALAEVGSRLNAGHTDYLDRLLELLEDAVALATALALARLTAGRLPSDSLQRAVNGQLAQPSLGKRLALMSEIDREHPGACGWDLGADMRSTAWPGGLLVPERRETTLAFHHERGLFEVMVYSGAAAAQLESAVVARLGPPHREQGDLRFWDYPSGNDVVRVKVTLLSASDRGMSAIRAFYVSTANQYGHELDALCPR